MAALQRLAIGSCRCLQSVGLLQPPTLAIRNLSVANKVFDLHLKHRSFPCRTVCFSLRQRGCFYSQNSCGNLVLLHNPMCVTGCAKQFSSLTPDIGPLYSLISIKVKGIDEAVLKSYTEFITMAAGHLKLDISERIILPTSIQRHTVLKSPHIYKKHRAQYEVRTHARLLQVKNVTGDTADTFLEYIQRNIPEGVSMGVEQTALESLPDFFELPAEAKTFLDEQKSQSKKTELPAV
ncbi:putative 28S ribosomal protein S10 [Acropora cervicornis]|uniref:Small ribosomal subunit protein uS10m n=1 Tax=Acropora cervicornis TaxID=6130 RepID=A0AAD9V4N3_ACRCE|nr:putative 28S ribosomal protein S10 [Acropora cervicornis]